MYYADASTEGLGLPGGWAGFRKLAVRPEMQCKGLGRKLVERCIGMARDQAASVIGIHTVSFMTAARRMYEEIGFHRCPEFDLKATDMLSVGAAAGEVIVMAYRLDLDPRRQPVDQGH